MPRRGKPAAWLRLKNERARAYEAFRIYLDLGAQRSVVKTRELYRQRAGTSRIATLQTFEAWCQRFQWVQRARAYDEHAIKIQEEARWERLQRNAKLWADREQEFRERIFQLGIRLIEEAERIQKLPVAFIEKVEQLAQNEDGTPALYKNGKPVAQVLTIIKPTKCTKGNLPALAQTGANLCSRAILNQDDAGGGQELPANWETEPYEIPEERYLKAEPEKTGEPEVPGDDDLDP